MHNIKTENLDCDDWLLHAGETGGGGDGDGGYCGAVGGGGCCGGRDCCSDGAYLASACYRCISSFSCTACTRTACCSDRNVLYTSCPIDPFHSMRSILVSTFSSSSDLRNYRAHSNLDTFAHEVSSPVQQACNMVLVPLYLTSAIVGRATG